MLALEKQTRLTKNDIIRLASRLGNIQQVESELVGPIDEIIDKELSELRKVSNIIIKPHTMTVSCNVLDRALAYRIFQVKFNPRYQKLIRRNLEYHHRLRKVVRIQHPALKSSPTFFPNGERCRINNFNMDLTSFWRR